MVEIWVLYGLAGIVLFVGSIIGGFLAKLAWEEISMLSLERRIKRLENTLISGSGVASRQEKAERQQEAMLKVAELVKEGKDPKDALKEVAMAYPDVAMGLIQKALKGGNLGSLGGLLGA